MEIITEDDAKDEVERLLINSIQIGSTWVSHTLAPRAVIVQGFTHGKVRVRVIAEANDGKATALYYEHHIVDFHAAYKLVGFE